MPQWYYIIMHSEAKLSDADKQALFEWTAVGGQVNNAGDGIDSSIKKLLN
jgi:hypothetical protein